MIVQDMILALPNPSGLVLGFTLAVLTGLSFQSCGSVKHPDIQLLDAAALIDTTPEELQRILDLGANIEARNSYGWTPLNNAMGWTHSTDKIQFLLDKGADIEARDNGGNTPLIRAASNWRGFATEIVVFLIENGAQIEARDNDGNTPLMMAAHGYSTLEIVQFLIDKGANIEARNNDGNTPLMLAARYSYINKIQLLIDSGAKIDVTNNDGSTPLMFAARNPWSPEIAQFLLDKGAEIDATNNDGWTALMFAADFCPPDGYIAQMRVAITPDLIVQLLLEKGADPLLLSKAGKKAIDYADSNVKFLDTWTYWNLYRKSDVHY